MTNSSNSNFDLKGPSSNDYNSHDKEIESVPVSEALRRHSGRMKVKGTITGLTKLFKILSISVCETCKIKFVNFET